MSRKRDVSKPPDADAPSFEEAIEQLEAIIDRIESGEVGLEAALSQYERGMGLIQRCRTILDSAQKKIAELTVDEQGRLGVSGEPRDAGGYEAPGDAEAPGESDDDAADESTF